MVGSSFRIWLFFEIGKRDFWRLLSDIEGGGVICDGIKIN